MEDINVRQTKYLVLLEYDKTRARYLKLDNLEQNDGSPISQKKSFCSYRKKLHKTGRVGSIYKVEIDEEGSTCWNAKSVPIDTWKNKEDILTLQIQRRTDDLRDSKLTALSENQLDKILKPIREIYLEADSRQRSIILAEVIQKITKNP